MLGTKQHWTPMTFIDNIDTHCIDKKGTFFKIFTRVDDYWVNWCNVNERSGSEINTVKVIESILVCLFVFVCMLVCVCVCV